MAMFKSLSEALKNVETCTTLKLNLKTKDFPADLLTLKNLQELYLEAPLLKELPSLQKLVQLRLLSIKAPVFAGRLGEIFLLPNLRNLKLIETPVPNLAMKLQEKMAPLQSLTIKSGELKALPLEIAEITTLEELVLPDNQLKELPFNFASLVKLKRLNLDGNAFTTFPDTIKQLPQLLHVSIDGNHFSEEEKARIQRQFGLTPN